MSLRVTGGVYLVPPTNAPLSPGNAPQNQNKPPAAVAIVTPQRSNSLDFLNFEEKRQLIASSLSLTDFLHHSGSATSPSSPTSGNVYVGKSLVQPIFVFCRIAIEIEILPFGVILIWHLDRRHNFSLVVLKSVDFTNLWTFINQRNRSLNFQVAVDYLISKLFY